jgi:hypothetical protein
MIVLKNRRNKALSIWKLIGHQQWELLRLANSDDHLYDGFISSSSKQSKERKTGTKLPVFTYAIWKGAPLDVLQFMASVDRACPSQRQTRAVDSLFTLLA